MNLSYFCHRGTVLGIVAFVPEKHTAIKRGCEIHD